jgi:hypothetical protein
MLYDPFGCGLTTLESFGRAETLGKDYAEA